MNLNKVLIRSRVYFLSVMTVTACVPLTAKASTVSSKPAAQMTGAASVALPSTRSSSAGSTATAVHGPVFTETLKLFEQAFTSDIPGSEVLGALKSTGDAKLTPFFMAVSRSSSPELQLIGLLDANAVSKNSTLINVPKLLAIPIPRLIAPSLAVMIQSGNISSQQLMTVMNAAVDPSEKLIAASELINRGTASAAMKVINELTGSQNDSIRYYAALTLLQYHQAGQAELGHKLLMELANHDAARLVDLKKALLARAASEKITATATWAAAIARNKQNPWSLRRRAVQTLLVLGDPAGPSLMADMLHSASGTIDKIEMGLLAIQYPKGLTIADVRSLSQTDSPLLMGIAKTADIAVSGKDPFPGIMDLIQQGQPILLNWALAYASAKGTAHHLTILNAIIGYATTAGNGEDTDFHRAVTAATLLADANGKAERKILAADLNSPHAGVVEAVLAGMLQSHNADFASLIEPYWTQFMQQDHHKIRDFAAMELAREGQNKALPVLRNIVLYGLNLSNGFRAAAGWYYLKIAGHAPALLAAVQQYASLGTGGK